MPEGATGKTGDAPPRMLVVATVHATASAFLLPFGERYRRLGWRVDAAAFDATKNEKIVAAFDHVYDVPFSRSPAAAINHLRSAAVIRRIAREGDYDLVHVHTPIAAAVTRYALRRMRARRGRPKMIYTAHGFHFYPGGPPISCGMYRAFEKVCGWWTDELIVINRIDEQAAKQYRIVPPEHVHYMPGVGVDLDYYNSDLISDEQTAAVRRELGLGEGDALLSMPANFDPGKRHADLLRALAILNRPHVHLAFAGRPGVQEEPLKELAAQLGLSRQVHFLGFRDDVPTLLRASAAMVLPSEREGLPRSVMEAMCIGTPVVVARYRGWKDLIGDDGGRSCEVGDADGLAAELAWVLDHRDQAAEMATRARARMEEHSLEKVLAMHDRLYADTLGRPDLFPAGAENEIATNG